MESACKDMECTFRILKKKFVFLKNPIVIHSPERIEVAFLPVEQFIIGCMNTMSGTIARVEQELQTKTTC